VTHDVTEMSVLAATVVSKFTTAFLGNECQNLSQSSKCF